MSDYLNSNQQRADAQLSLVTPSMAIWLREIKGSFPWQSAYTRMRQVLMKGKL